MSLADKTIKQQVLEKLEKATLDLTVSIYHIKYTKNGEPLKTGWIENAKIAIDTIHELGKML